MTWTSWTSSDGKAVVYHGDTMEVLPALIADGVRADMLACDPPYLLTSGGPSGLMRGIFDPAQYDNGGHLVACDIDWTDFMPLFYEVLADRAHAYVMANNRNVQAMLNAARWPTGAMPKGALGIIQALGAALTNGDRQPLVQKLVKALGSADEGFEFHNLLVWDKVSATPNRWYMKNGEFTGLFYKGNAFAINDCSSMSVIRLPHQDVSDHPTEKPVALMELFVRNSTQPGQTVIDPFAGSGSTGVAAVKCGRRFIGIEKDERWFKVACDRIEGAGRNVQGGLF